MWTKLLNVFWLCLIFVWCAAAQPLDQKIPKNVIFYVAGDSSVVPAPDLPNYRAAMDKFFQSLDDILEWRVLKSEWQAVLQNAGGADGLTPLSGDPWAFTLTGMDQAAVKLPSLIYIARVKDVSQADKVLSGLFDSLAKVVPTLQTDYDDYHGTAIRSLYGPGMIPGLGLSYTFQDSYLVLSNSKPQLVRLFDQWEFDDGENLAANPLYQQMMAKLPAQRNWTLFYDNTQISGGLKMLVDTLKELQKMKATSWGSLPFSGQSQQAFASASGQSQQAFASGEWADILQDVQEGIQEAAQEVDEVRREIAEETTSDATEPSSAPAPNPAQSMEDMQKGFENMAQTLQQTLQGFGHTANFDTALRAADVVFPILSAVQGTGMAWVPAADGKENTVAVTLLDAQTVETSGPFSQVLHRAPVAFPFKNFLPRQTGNITATNLLNLKDIWTIVQSILQQVPDVQGSGGPNAFLQSQFGFSPEDDLLSWMGDEWAVVRPVMDLESVVPINRAALLIHTTDPAKAAQGLRKLGQVITQKFGLPVTEQSESYKGKDIVSYQLALPVAPFVPAWAVVGDTVLLGSHVALVREMLDAQADPVRSGIERNRYFKQLSDTFNQPANKVTFQDIESETYANREAVRRVASISEVGKMIQSDEEMLPSILLDRVSYFLTCMQIFKASVKRSWVEENWVNSTKVLIKRDLSSVPPDNYILRYKVSLGLKDAIAQYAASCSDHGDVERAARLYTVLSEFYPKESTYLSALASLYRQQGRNEEAVAVYDKTMAALPETSLLVERETLRAQPDSNTQEMVQRIQAEAQKSNRIAPDAALFGLAINLRDKNGFPEQKPIELLDSLLNVYPLSPLASTARAERATLRKEGFLEKVDVSLAAEVPDNDAATEDAVWSRSTGLMLFPASGTDQDPQLTIQVVRSPKALHFRLQGHNPSGGDVKMDRIRISLNPTRNYTDWMDILLERSSDSYSVSLVRRSTDFHDIRLQDQPKENREEVSWPLSLTQDGNAWVVEFSAPLEALVPDQNGLKGVWPMNANRKVETESGSVESALPKAGADTDDFVYLALE